MPRLDIRIEGETPSGFTRCLVDGDNKFSEAVSMAGQFEEPAITIYLANLPKECDRLVIRKRE